MKVIHALTGVALAATVAGTLAAQEPQPRPRAALIQMRCPGCPIQGPIWGQRQGRIQGIGRQMGGLPGMGIYAPPVLLARREALGLTDEQASQLEALVEELKSAHEKATEEAKGHQEAMMEAWQADEPDVAALRQHAEALMQAQHQAHLTTLTAAARAKALLTSEQRGRVQGWMDAGRMTGYRRGLRRPVRRSWSRPFRRWR
ncbi:MAG: periplasmic heavy metal sensor [Gemmatimonadales bacterium]|nr:periplasmic heavy metal sensor [Gemmatimonadales bacterium]NIN13035.1 periplasmic heavy metal sensor [Gemmatimonadales bacterium]NIN51119.1 periplasmic heavy metal sensor [Gemmatimonadales bacterium]NIP08583.1 periplasmic heavy metal sensor [Gemmatimonadales bacterium]NIQ99693.1 periplasmic heavy metal sensor [Gemmatimonadales bacterium]